MEIAVLVSTYNGQKFLKEQIDSILMQNYGGGIKLIIRDDGSSDDTISIIKEYQRRNYNITLIEGENCGCEESFNRLCEYALTNVQSEFYAFCDQDDVWLPDKLEIACKTLSYYPKNTPNLYFSNMSLVTENLEFIRDMHDATVDTEEIKKLSLIKIFTYGCTCVFNRTALEYYCKPKVNNCLHDHWIFMVCSILGIVTYDSTSHILYRQHHSNLSGEKKSGFGLFKQRFRKLRNGLQGHMFENLALQLYKNFKDEIPENDMKVIRNLIKYRSNLKSKLNLLFSNKYRTGDIMKDFCIKYRIISNHL